MSSYFSPAHRRDLAEDALDDPDGPPPDYTELEGIADAAKLNPEALRAYLLAEIERRDTKSDVVDTDAAEA